MTQTQLHELLAEIDSATNVLNEILVTELALRDELEFDKELKNQFISLLLTIQKKRRECHNDQKKKKAKSGGNAANETGSGNVSLPSYCFGIFVVVS